MGKYNDAHKLTNFILNSYCPSCMKKGVYFGITHRITKKNSNELTCIYCKYIHRPDTRLNKGEVREKILNDLI